MFGKMFTLLSYLFGIMIYAFNQVITIPNTKTILSEKTLKWVVT